MGIRRTEGERSGRRSGYRRALLFVEYGLLFVVLPVGLSLDWIPLPLPLIPTLWVLTAFCLVHLVVSRDFDRTRLWNARNLGNRLPLALIPFAAAAPMLLAFTALAYPERLFALVLERPGFWLLVILLYPLLSVYPQGIVYRAFIFHRYRDLFPTRWSRIVASALAFSLVHVIFQNWIAPLLTLGGGLLFAWTYARTRSLLVVAFQHAVFGAFLFLIGLGWYFYHGALSGG